MDFLVDNQLLFIELHHSTRARSRLAPDVKAPVRHTTEEIASIIEIPRPKSDDEDDSGSAKILGFEIADFYNWPMSQCPTS